MKKIVNKVFVVLILALSSPSVFSNSQMQDIRGAWLGTMKIPEGPSLRIGIEVFKKADGNWGGNIASLDQGARYMLVSKVTIKNGLFTLQMAGAPVSVVGKVSANNKVISAKFHQGNSVFDLDLNKVASLPETVRVQTPVMTNEYIQQEVRYQNSHDNVWLSGTLTLPNGLNKHPAVMLVAGSGPNHRDSYHAGHRTFKVLADYLTKLGYIVLRADKRGVYKSSGSFHDARLEDLVLDTQAAVQYLKSHARVEPNNVTLIGHSEGSLVSIMTTEREEVQGIVSLAGPGMSVLDILLLQDQTEPAAKGATKTEISVLHKFSQSFYSMILNTPSSALRKQKAIDLYANLEADEGKVVAKWVDKNNGTLSLASAESDSFYEFLQQNPLPYWTKFKGKALILNGDKDSQVPANENVQGIMSAISSNGVNIESEIFRGLNHLFQPATTGSVNEYKQIEQTLDTQVMAKISNWLERNVK